MIILIFLGIGMMFFGLVYVYESGAFRKVKRYDAVLVDETEDEVFDNTGGTKTRFFKVYEFDNGNQKQVVRTRRPMKRITNAIGARSVIWVDEKNRTAMDKSDVLRYIITGVVLMIAGCAIIGCVLYVKYNLNTDVPRL